MAFNLHNNHQLITRQQNYFLHRRVLTIHSEDRDISKWNNSNEFEIQLPNSYENVQSIRLLQYNFPTKLYVFSEKYQNTKLSFNTDTSSNIITIDDGTYTPTELAQELTNKINNDTVIGNINFKIFYNKVNNKFLFGADQNFKFDFTQLSLYTNCSNNIYNQYTNWGLGFHLGFEKKLYTSELQTGKTIINYSNTEFLSGNKYLITSNSQINILGNNSFYIDVDKCNFYDELYPYSSENNSSYNNNYGGKQNAAFAKININSDYSITYTYENVVGKKGNTGFANFEPPLEKLSKLKFRFRYHNGTLVDFNNQPFNFTIEINSFINEIGKYFEIRKPELL